GIGVLGLTQQLTDLARPLREPAALRESLSLGAERLDFVGLGIEGRQLLQVVLEQLQTRFAILGAGRGPIAFRLRRTERAPGGRDGVDERRVPAEGIE